MTEEEMENELKTNGCTKEISSIQDFATKINELQKEWIFRGQKLDDGYKTRGLKTSLERYLGRDLVSKTRDIEAFILREFQRRAGQYLSSLPLPDDTLEWLSIMRHYGAPTRLLDWTYSPYVAAFNAIEEGKPGEVWALNALRINKSNKYKQYGTQKSRKEVNKLFFVRPKTRVVHLSPFVLNERLTIQQGTFLAPGNIEQSFIENLKATTKGSFKPEFIRRFKIGLKNKGADEYQLDKDGIQKFLQNLNRMNITRASLYPGLQGFCESFRARIAMKPGWIENPYSTPWLKCIKTRLNEIDPDDWDL